jgi:hypothetical protein
MADNKKSTKTKKDVQDQRRIGKVLKSVLRLNDTNTKLSDNINFNAFGSDTSRSVEQDRLNKGIDEIINTELSEMREFTGQDISTFLVKLFNDHDRENQKSIKHIEDIFNVEDGSIIQFFYERYKNINLLYEDLNVLNEQLFQLNEAVLATRDAIVTSDDMSQVLSRNITFKNLPDDNKLDSYVNLVKQMEEDLNLQTKIKDHIIPKTLTYGNYYVYTIPYSKLLENYTRMKQKDYAKSMGLKESVEGITLEHVSEESLKPLKEKYGVNEQLKNLATTLNKYMDNITIYNTEMGIPILEGVDIDVLSPDEKFKTDVKKSVKDSKYNKTSNFTDGTVKMDKKNTDFSNVTGCHFQLLDPRKVIPVKILDKVLGYYYLHESPAQIKTTFTTTITVSGTTRAFNNSEQIEHEFISRITDKIVKAFDKKYLLKNEKFKDLIINALRYNDLYKKQIKFEFIPATYMTEFKINEDENGQGVSILYRSLFYGKLYLALLLFKMIAIITRSTDTKIYYIKQSGMDQNLSNSLQSVARSIKERQLNVMDLLTSNPNLINKIGHLKDIFIPVG